jgi:hypothetical protein
MRRFGQLRWLSPLLLSLPLQSPEKQYRIHATCLVARRTIASCQWREQELQWHITGSLTFLRVQPVLPASVLTFIRAIKEDRIRGERRPSGHRPSLAKP